MKQVFVWVNPPLLMTTDFVFYMSTQGFSVEYLEEFYTPSVEGIDSRNNLLFTIADDNWAKFSLWRLQYSIHPWETYLDSGMWEYIPKEMLKKYPYTWGSRPNKYIADNNPAGELILSQL